jgi:hypothetical protein
MKTVVLAPATAALPPGYTESAFREVIRRAAAHWSFPNVPCAVKVEVGVSVADWRATQDGVNVVAYRGRTWCHNEKCGATATFPLSATAMTTTYPGSVAAGATAEADIELNGVRFAFTDKASAPVGVPPGVGAVGLEPVLVHEIGHVLGLHDVCADYGGPTGRPVPTACTSADRARVMFGANVGVEPKPADIEELCSLYPSDSSSAVIALTDIGSSRAFFGGALGASLFLTAAALIATAVRVRRARRRRGSVSRGTGVTRCVTARPE